MKVWAFEKITFLLLSTTNDLLHLNSFAMLGARFHDAETMTLSCVKQSYNDSYSAAVDINFT